MLLFFPSLTFVRLFLHPSAPPPLMADSCLCRQSQPREKTSSNASLNRSSRLQMRGQWHDCTHRSFLRTRTLIHLYSTPFRAPPCGMGGEGGRPPHQRTLETALGCMAPSIYAEVYPLLLLPSSPPYFSFSFSFRPKATIIVGCQEMPSETDSLKKALASQGSKFEVYKISCLYNYLF